MFGETIIEVPGYSFAIRYSVAELLGNCGIGVIYDFSIGSITTYKGLEIREITPSDVLDGRVPDEVLEDFKKKVREEFISEAKDRGFSMVISSDAEIIRTADLAYYSLTTPYQTLRLRDILEGHWTKGPSALNIRTKNTIAHYTYVINEAK